MNEEDRAREVLASLHTGKKRARLLHGPISYAGGISPSAAIRAMLAFTAATPTETPESEGAVPAGMKPWAGGDSAPADYQGGKVAFRGGQVSMGEEGPWFWKHGGGDSDIIAYTPKAKSQAPNQGVQALADRSTDGEAVATLFDAIAHGDEEHRAWLKQAIEDHFAGRPIAPVEGSGTSEALRAQIRELEAALALTSHAGEVRALEAALLSVLDAVRDYLPPDGISKDDALGRIIDAVDNPTINPIIREIENGRS